jgi:hypothetical protein
VARPEAIQSPTPPYQENIVEASRSSLAFRVQRYGYCDYSFSLFFTSLLIERPFFPLASRFYSGSDGLGFIHSPQPRVSFVQLKAGGFNLTQVRLGG